jgi:hypothetical protein
VIDDLHVRTTRLLRLAQFMHAASAMLAADDPLARLASEYQSYLVGVRNLRYESIEAEHDTALFGRPDISSLLRERLGFTFGEFTTVRSAIQERYSRILTSLREETGGIVMRCEAEGRDPTGEEIEAFCESMSAFMLLRGERASFTVSDIAGESSLEPGRVKAVLDAFSIGFGGTRDAAATVGSFLCRVNPLARTGLVRDAAGNYLMTGNQIGTDSFRMIAETALKTDGRVWRRYDRIRADVSEVAALAAVSRAAGTPGDLPEPHRRRCAAGAGHHPPPDPRVRQPARAGAVLLAEAGATDSAGCSYGATDGPSGLIRSEMSEKSSWGMVKSPRRNGSPQWLGSLTKES